MFPLLSEIPPPMYLLLFMYFGFPLCLCDCVISTVLEVVLTVEKSHKKTGSHTSPAIIGGYGIGDSDSELNSSAHTTYNSPSSFVELLTLEPPFHTLLISLMDMNDCLWNMEEELTWN
jgi:hypothetical protein